MSPTAADHNHENFIIPSKVTVACNAHFRPVIAELGKATRAIGVDRRVEIQRHGWRDQRNLIHY